MSKTTHVSTRQHMVLALELYKRIPYWHKVTASELQSQLKEVGIIRDIRTIQRNMDVLLEYFDIERDDRDKPYGYQRKQKKSLVASGEQEALLLCLAESHIHHLIPANTFHTLRSIFKDANSQLGSLSHDSKESQWLRKVSLFGGHKLSVETSPEIYDAISKGLYHNRWLSLRYHHKIDSQINEVMPLGLVQMSTALLLICRKKGAPNTSYINVGHIQQAILSTFTFDYPQNFNLQRAMSNYIDGSQKPYLLEFSIEEHAGSHLYKTPLSDDQKITKYDGYLCVTATVTNTFPLLAWLTAHEADIIQVNQSPTDSLLLFSDVTTF